jgi:hypothetical protein
MGFEQSRQAGKGLDIDGLLTLIGLGLAAVHMLAATGSREGRATLENS